MDKEKVDANLEGKILIDNLEDLLFMYNNYRDEEYLMSCCDDKLKDNLEVAKLLCFEGNGSCGSFGNYAYVSDRLKDNKELLLYMLENLKPLFSNNGIDYYWYNGVDILLSMASENLRKDKDIVLLACEKDPFNYEDFADPDQRAIYYVDKSLLHDKDFILKIVSTSPDVLLYIDNENHAVFEDKEYVKKLIEVQPFSIKYVSDRLKDDKELALIAVKLKGITLKYVSDRLRNDKEVVIESLNQDKDAFKYISEELKYDDAIIEYMQKCDYVTLEG